MSYAICLMVHSRYVILKRKEIATSSCRCAFKILRITSESITKTFFYDHRTMRDLCTAVGLDASGHLDQILRLSPTTSYSLITAIWISGNEQGTQRRTPIDPCPRVVVLLTNTAEWLSICLPVWTRWSLVRSMNTLLGLLITPREVISLLRRERHPEHHKLVVVIESCVVRLPKGDSIRRHKVIVGLKDIVSETNSDRVRRELTAVKRK